MEKLPWKKIIEEHPPEYQTVLTWHEEDLFPVPAFHIEGDWLRETEGPEDSFFPEGRYASLYRQPTHWLDLKNIGL